MAGKTSPVTHTDAEWRRMLTPEPSILRRLPCIDVRSKNAIVWG
jgi:hypothetical protein